MNLIVIDTETSDLEPSQGATILELAYMILSHDNGKWKPTSAHETYIQYDGYIHPKAQASHHIRPDSLRAPRAIPRADAVNSLVQILEPDSFVVAHNSDFDSKFLPEITNPWICTYKSARKIWPTAPGYSNQVLRYWLNITPDLSLAPSIKHRSPHQALYDVATTAGIVLKMLENKTPAELYELCKPQLLETIGFGKHKGAKFNQIPIDYLAWLRGQGNLEPDLKFTIDSILQPHA